MTTKAASEGEIISALTAEIRATTLTYQERVELRMYDFRRVSLY